MKKVFKTKEEWLEIRSNKITATRLVALMGLSSYKTNVDVYELIVGIQKENDTQENERMKMGAEIEKHIRGMFITRHPEYELIKQQDNEYVFFVDDEYDYIGTSCDGEVVHKETNEQGLLEIKYFEGYSNSKKFTKDSIRDDCYAQLVHEIRTAKKDFGWFIVALDYNDMVVLREYYVRAENCKEDMEVTLNVCKEFYNKYVVTKTRPPLAMSF